VNIFQASVSTKSKATAAAKEQVKTAADIFHEQRVTARLAITEHWTCETHSLPSKPSLCFKNPSTGLCHPITENNLNLWAALHVSFFHIIISFALILHKVKDPVAYPATEKPAEVNVLGNTARGRVITKPTLTANTNEQVPFPYGCYPPPFMAPAMYYSSMGFPQFAPGIAPPAVGFTTPPSNTFTPPGLPMPATVASAAPTQPLNYPLIPEWIKYCDQHPNRSGASLTPVIPSLVKEGFCYVNQLRGDHVTIENLSRWLSIGPGTADLLMRFAEEDCRLIAAGTFTMQLPQASGLAAAAEI